ncbi:MAG: lytic transglycosylase domain-containing protein [Pelagibacteraceae bacterium]
MSKLYKIILLLGLLLTSPSQALSNDFNLWLDNFKSVAIDNGISQNTIDKALKNAKFLPNVIKYDRYQPEFYEDTLTYIKKRTNSRKVKNGSRLFFKDKKLIISIEKKFLVEKELLLALMGIETNFGKYLGKMDIISSLATLSFDKRRSIFFTNELITLLKLIDNNVIDYNLLYGSWAGAYGNFQFMPSTINKYALDFDNNSSIELTKKADSFASAANYMNKIGWKKDKPCYKKIELKNNIPQKYLNTSAKKIKNKKKYKFFKKFIINSNLYNFDDNEIVGIITPDSDIIPNSKNLSPAYVVFENYELILKWNRSLRFALAVCTLKDKIKNEI